MRYFGCALSLMLLLAFVAPSGWTQCPANGCYNGMCPGQGPPNGYYNCPPQYPRYPGYGYSSSNYYQMPPPHVLGGPAYAFSYPYPWSAYCAPAGRSYIAPAYPSCYYYPFTGQTQSFYAGPNYGAANNNGSVFATERTKPWPPSTSAPTSAPAPAKTATAPAKTTTTAAKQPTTLPDSISSKKDSTPSLTSEAAAQRPGFMSRLLFWQK